MLDASTITAAEEKGHPAFQELLIPRRRFQTGTCVSSDGSRSGMSSGTMSAQSGAMERSDGYGRPSL